MNNSNPQSHYNEYKLSPKDIRTIEDIWLRRFQARAESSRSLAEDWFHVILDFMRHKNLELAPKGTMQKYMEVVGDE